MKITSDNIDWKDGMTYVVVDSFDNSIISFHYTDTVTSLYDSLVRQYIVERPQPNPSYTHEMYETGDLPEIGMNCGVRHLNGNTYQNCTINYISTNGVVYTDNDSKQEYFYIFNLYDMTIFLPLKSQNKV